MKTLSRSRGHWVLAVVILTTALAGCMTGPVAPEIPPAPPQDQEAISLFVGPVLADCADAKCLLVREGNADGPFEISPSGIAGFEREDGFNYELKVRRAAEGSPAAYELVEVVNKAPAGAVSMLYIAPMLVECETTEIFRCLLAADSPEGEYRPFYGKIVGFDYQEGNTYALLVEDLAVEQPPADAPAGVWKLLAVTETTPGGAVAAPAPAAGTALEGTLWMLTSWVDGNGQTQPVLEGSEVTATFGEGRIVGSAGCNNYTAEYAVDGAALTIGPAASTMMACASEELTAQEAAYLLALSAVTSYEITGETLSLKNAAGETVLLFAATAPVTLTGTTWAVTNYNNGREAVVGMLADTEVTMTFGEDGQMFGFAGCNNFAGGFTVDGDKITIGPLVSTMMMCAQPEGIMEQEQLLLAALQAATVYAIRGDTLELRDDGGALQVMATAQPAATATMLTGATWDVVNYNNGKQAVVSLLEGTAITMTFGEDDQVSGTAGCNNFAGGYVVDGKQITVGPLASTMMLCVEPEGVMEQEQAFLAALQAATVFEIAGDTLEMRDADGALQVVAKAQAAEAPVATPTESGPTAGVPLEGTPWVLTAYVNATGETVSPLEGTQVTATFADGRVSGNASCNNYGAEYTVDGNALQVGIAITTMMLCQPEEVGEQEMAYLAALATVASYQIEGTTLVLADANGQAVLTFGVLEQTSLTDTEWQVSFYNNGKAAMVSPLAGTAITLLFVEDGNVTGNAGCNNFTGDYALDGNQVTIGELATTRMLCAEPQGAMEQETAFLAALQSSASFQITGGDLEMLDASGARTVTAYAHTPALAAGGEPEDVVGKTWLWQGATYADDTTLQAEDPSAFTLELLADGSALVRADCNSLAGTYTLAADGSLTLDLPDAGLSKCDEGSQAEAFLSDLSQAVVFSLADGRLYLALEADAGSIEFAEAGAVTAPAAGEVTPMPAGEATLTGVVWAWQSLDMSDGTVTPVANPEAYTIEFLEDGTLNLQADCNRGGGAYTTQDGSLTIEAAALTRMACPPGSLADQYVARLNEVASYVIDGGQLFLNLKMDSGNMVFAPLAADTERETEPAATAAPAPTPAPTAAPGATTFPIVGPTWEWTGYQAGADRYVVAAPEKYTVAFMADGAYTVQADCNTGSGEYTASGRTLRITPAAMTRMACAPGSQDSAFLEGLFAATRYLVMGESLYIETGEGGLMKFVAAR